jgi:hypothetical protein
LLPALSATAAPAATTATTAPAATAAAARSATLATAAPTKPCSGWLGSCFIHVQSTTVQFRAVQLLNSGLGLPRVSHFDKREPARLPCVAVCNNIDSLHRPILGEGCVQLFLRRLIAQVTDKDIGQERFSFSGEFSLCQTTSVATPERAGWKHMIERRQAKTQ